MTDFLAIARQGRLNALSKKAASQRSGSVLGAPGGSERGMSVPTFSSVRARITGNIAMQ